MRANDNKSHQTDVPPARQFSPGTALTTNTWPQRRRTCSGQRQNYHLKYSTLPCKHSFPNATTCIHWHLFILP